VAENPLLMHLTLSRKDNCPIMTGRACAQTIDDEAAAWTARIDRGLSDSDQAELDAWLAQDSRRVGALARARAIWLHAERAESLAPLITEPEVVETPRHGLSRRRMMLGGAGALAAGLVGVVTMSPWLRPAPALRSGIGEIRRIPLADGSVVTLDTDSALEVVYSTATRLVRLIAGGAYFEVASSSRPFMVEVGGIVLRATAAAFAVQALPDSPLSVLVERGAVAMGKVGQNAIVDLAASTRITLEKGGPLTAAKTHKLASGEMDRALVWRNGMLSFEGETLEQAAATFRRYGRPFIEITDPALARRPITGLFSANDPAGFARTAALSLDARATVDGNVARLVPLSAR
jgi:transmembrane sensor